MVTIGHKRRPLRDGGGKPSPGRLPPSIRNRNTIADLGTRIIQACHYERNNNEALATSATALTYNTDGENPIPHEHTSHIQSIICEYTMTTNTVPDGQPFLLHTMSALANKADDPDWKYPLLVEHGINLGVDTDIDRSPDIWPTKEEMTEHPEPEEEPEPPTRHSNYPSAAEHEEAIIKTYMEECPVMVEGPYSEAQAARVCRCSPAELCHGAIAGKPEGRYMDKLRTIHDATVNMVNEWIQKHLHEKTTAPTLHDVLTVLHILDDTNVVLFKLDITKAHRRIKVRRSDWKYITAKVGNQVWVNKCGTYGVSSAQYYWGRMAALTIRILYALFPDILWAFVYVDDYIFVLRADTAPYLAMAIVVTMQALGCPISWKKTTIGEINNWVGFQIHAPAITAALTPDKQTIISGILNRLKQADQHSAKDATSLVGRLMWATAICLPMRPFLQPLYAWMLALNRRQERQKSYVYGRPPKDITLFADVMLDLINSPPRSPMPPVALTDIQAATDAGANDTDATVGGWYSTTASPQKHEVHWFSFPITKQDHPWAYTKETPKQCIAAIELYATLILLKHITTNSTLINMTLPLRTDNMGNSYTSTDFKCKKWPNSAILMEIALVQHHQRIRLDLQHVHRENNQWSDQLTHSDFHGFNKRLRFQPNCRNMQWYLLHKLPMFETLSSEPTVSMRAVS